MKKLPAPLGVLLLAAAMQAQEMTVVQTDGTESAFGLDEIVNVTFPESTLLTAGDLLNIHQNGIVTSWVVATIDSLIFPDSGLLELFLDSGSVQEYSLAAVDSLTFSEIEAISVTWNGSSVSVINPLESLGVAVEITGADVIVTAATGMDGIDYQLSGTGSDGMFKIYSDDDVQLTLNGLNLHNEDGPAINIQDGGTITVTLVDGTESLLSDGASYADPSNDEDQKAAFFSEDELVFEGAGSLTIIAQGDDQHGLACDDYIDVHDGSIVIQSAMKDGIHTNDGYMQSGGSVSVSSSSDGIDAGDGPVLITGGVLTVTETEEDKDAIKCDGEIVISGGELDLTVEGDMAKGLNAVVIQLTGGEIEIETSGDAVLEALGSGYDPSYCTAVKADELVQIDGASLTIVTTGSAGRGISCDGDITMLAGTLDVTSSGGGGAYTDETGAADAYHGPCLKADGDISLVGGMVNLGHSGLGGKAISGNANLSIGTADSTPVLDFVTTGGEISIGGGEYAEAKTISVDSLITITNCDLTIDSADDAIKSKYWIDITGGLINIVDSVEGIEAPQIRISGGEIHLLSTDDGINATAGVDGEFNDGSLLEISGGYVHLTAPGGDCIDSNGNLTISGGTVIVHGPPNQPEVGLDVNGTFRIDGGFLVVSQINGNHVETPSSQSTQRSVLLRRNTTINAGSMFHIEDASGNTLVSFMPDYRYSCVLVSSPELTSGTTYSVYSGGSDSGTEVDGLYEGGSYTPGTLHTSFTSSGMVQQVNF